MIHNSVLVDVCSEILNGKYRIMHKGIIVVSINPYTLNSLINQVIFMLRWRGDKTNYCFKEFSRKYAI